MNIDWAIKTIIDSTVILFFKTNYRITSLANKTFFRNHECAGDVYITVWSISSKLILEKYEAYAHTYIIEIGMILLND